MPGQCPIDSSRGGGADRSHAYSVITTTHSG
jgi:hypothetical protein